MTRVMMKKENCDYYDGNVFQRPVFKEIFQIHVLWFPRGRKPNLTIRDSVRQEEAIIGGWRQSLPGERTWSSQTLPACLLFLGSLSREAECSENWREAEFFLLEYFPYWWPHPLGTFRIFFDHPDLRLLIPPPIRDQFCGKLLSNRGSLVCFGIKYWDFCHICGIGYWELISPKFHKRIRNPDPPPPAP